MMYVLTGTIDGKEMIMKSNVLPLIEEQKAELEKRGIEVTLTEEEEEN